MPLKTSKTLPQSLRDKYKRNIGTEKKTPKKVLISKKWHPSCSHEVKTKSAGLIDSKQREKPDKTSSSLPAVPKYSESKDFCKTCGDTDDVETAVSVFSNNEGSSNSKTSAVSTRNNKKDLESNARQVTGERKVVKQYYKNEKYEDSKSTIDNTKKSSKNLQSNTKTSKELKTNQNEAVDEERIVQEHYLNEKFADLYDSMHDFDTIKGGQALDTITEVTNEKQASSESKRASSDQSTSSNIFEQSDDVSSLRRLKEFREKNYFECHSAKKRIENKASAISLKDHKCRFRLYLNERLFPVAIDNYHNDKIRCVDCHLPLELAREDDKANGTIQAKVKLGSETQDMVLLLPIKEPLIIKQKRKEKVDDEVVYFGLVRLDQNGNSMFNRALPSDSLALRYQKGYRQYNDVQSYSYDKMEESDVVFV